MLVAFTMKTNYLLGFLSLLTCSIRGSTSDSLHHCGDWTPYQMESCVNIIAADDGFRNKDAAASYCQTIVDSNEDRIPNLITIKTTEKQAFLETFLFVNNSLEDNVWLGLVQGEDGVFRWNDGHEVNYTNWAKQNITDQSLRCVFLDSGEGAYGRGQWVRTKCKKRNVVVCEKAQVLPASTIHDAVLHLQQQMETQLAVVNEKIGQLELSNAALQKEICNVKQNPVPVGFIYMQLPSHAPPTTIWPAVKWSDVTSMYAGLFFRAAGGSSAPFGVEQPDNTRRVKTMFNPWWNGIDNRFIEIPDNGAWSESIWSGSATGGRNIGLKFQTTTGEVRPRNKAVRIWQRIN